MEWLEQIWQSIVGYINMSYLLTFMFLAYFVKKNFAEWLNKVTKFEWKSVYTVLIIATVVAIPYIVCGEEWQKVLFSYALGTSLHELIIGFIEDKLNKK